MSTSSSPTPIPASGDRAARLVELLTACDDHGWTTDGVFSVTLSMGKAREASEVLSSLIDEPPAPVPEREASEPTPTLRDLQRINQARSDRWMAGSPGWTTLEIAGELAGEVGELANVCKKLRRSEMGVPGNKLSDAELMEQARGELGDVFIVTMLTASKLGVDLYEATREAFNRKSEQMGFPERFPALPSTENSHDR